MKGKPRTAQQQARLNKQLGRVASGPSVPAAGSQAAALRSGATPPPATTTTPVNPMQQSAFNSASDFESSIADQTNVETTRELSRARDDLSVGLKAEGEAATSRGAGAGYFANRFLASGARDIANLQARLAGENLRARQGAIAGKTEAAGAGASEQNRLHLGTQAASIDQQRVDLEGADQQYRFDQAPYDRAMEMMRLTSGLQTEGFDVGAGNTIYSGGLVGSDYTGGGSTGEIDLTFGRAGYGAFGTPSRRLGARS